MPNTLVRATAVVAVGSLLVLAPTVAEAAIGSEQRAKNICMQTPDGDQWSGQWSFSVAGGKPGKLKLNLTRDGKSVRGVYTGTTNGTIWGTLDRTCGTAWTGKFADTSGENHNTGSFEAELKYGEKGPPLIAPDFKGTFHVNGGDYYTWMGWNTTWRG